MTEAHVDCLRASFTRVLGQPVEGSMAYTFCLPPEVVAALCSDDRFQVPGWQVYAVGGAPGASNRSITADRAVELREEKLGNVLLLVDPKEAGAGMDGIYSAVRELGEQEVLDSAIQVARHRLDATIREFAERAHAQARRLGRIHTLSPYRIFDFYACCAESPDAAGELISILGLWPIDTSAGFHPEDLGVSAQIVDRLLLTSGADHTVQARIDSLLLRGDAEGQARQLHGVLRAAEGKRWTETVASLSDHPDLWLNRLRPGFDQQELRGLDIIPWRASAGAGDKLLAWSGLALEDSGYPAFLLGVDNHEKGKAEKKLEVRWKTQPIDLLPGAVEYEISVTTGSGDVLAKRSMAHTGKETQRCVFTREDFDELDEGGKWTARIQVHPVGEPEPGEIADSARWKETEDFILAFGTTDAAPSSAVGKKTRALVEEAIRLPEELFAGVDQARLGEDKQGFITWRVKDRTARISRPPLIKAVEEDWQHNGFPVGRWLVRVRADGSRAGQPQFVAISASDVDPALWRRLEETSRQMGQRALAHFGFTGLIHRDSDIADRYVNAWAAALEAGPPSLALAHTVEVQDLMGETVGLIVLPSHPLRVAWHQAYDELAYHACYREGLKPTEVVKTLAALDGSYMPTFLPGLPILPSTTRFVFGDMLGFYAVAMLRSDEPEPQAAIAQMARCVSPQREDLAPSVGGATAAAIGREIGKYADLHPAYTTFHLNVLRPGDGLTMAQALGGVQNSGADAEERHDGPEEVRCFQLNLFPGDGSSDLRMLGRFLSETAEKRRAGIGAVPDRDRWMLQSRQVGAVSLPLLRWSKHTRSAPDGPAHLSVAFDTFTYELRAQPEEERGKGRPLEVYGLMPSLEREFRFEPVPTWTTTVAAQVDGDRHPVSRALSDRLQRMHTAVLKAAAENLDDGSWPVLTTRVTAEKADALRRLHELSDWVVTVDRNAGVEYFDAPRQAPEVFETYVIDCVPERQDLDCVQLVTSTANVREVMRLLDQALADMSLSCSPRNCEFLLANLKAVSGRLAMRLASYGLQRGELIALALFHASCVQHGDESEWLSMRDGFLVPLDDVRDLLMKPSGRTGPPAAGISEAMPVYEPGLRSDLVYVSLSRRGGLQFTFVEVKYRRLLRSARHSELLEQIRQQTSATRDRWFDSYFSSDLTPTQLAVRRKRLARALRFYADKAQRHDLVDETYQRLCIAIDRLFRSDYEPAPEQVGDRGYIFCPDHPGPPTVVADDDLTRVILFGPQRMPDAPVVLAAPAVSVDGSNPAAAAKHGEAPAPVPEADNAMPSAGGDEALEQGPARGTLVTEASLLVGRTLEAETPVRWSVSLRGNPHLMIVGQPGMGKTTCIVNLCAQLAERGITPLVFSYHDDLESKLAARLGRLNYADIESGLGFNPMFVVGGGQHAWIDNVGMLRDIFASIYPDLGDLQTNEIREAIKKSYQDQGFGGDGRSSADLNPPEFQRFFDLLKRKSKPNVGLMARLDELNDYGFFRNAGGRASLLESRETTIIRLHATQNEVLQNAMASFVLLNLYQSMFLRGPQPELTHAIVLDEAHRASRLKLLPTMAKECRKFGLSLIVASQEAKDFSPSLYAAVANYLVLRVTEGDANALAKNAVQSSEAHRLAGRLKQLDKYTAMFVSEGRRSTYLRLQD